MTRLGILLSGRGSNFEAIANHIASGKLRAEIAVVISEEQGEVDKFRQWGLDITPHRKLLKEGFVDPDRKRISVEEVIAWDRLPAWF